MKIERKIIWPFIIFFISLILIEIIFYNFFALTKLNYQNIVNSDTRFNNHENVLVYYDLFREGSFANYLNSNQDQYKQRYDNYVVKSNELYTLLQNEITNERLREIYSNKYLLFNNIVEIEKSVLNGQADKSVIESEEYLKLKSDFAQTRDLPKEFYQISVKSDMTDNINKADRFFVIMIIAVLFSLILIVIVFITIRRDVLLPMQKISYGLGEMSKGKAPIVDLNTNTEMKDVISKMNTTSLDLLKAKKQILKEKEKELSKNKKLKNMTTKLSSDVHNLKGMVKLGMVVNENLKKEKSDKTAADYKNKIKELNTEIENLQGMVKLSMVVNENMKREKEKLERKKKQ